MLKMSKLVENTKKIKKECKKEKSSLHQILKYSKLTHR